MAYGFVIRYSYVSALQILGSETLLDRRTEERLEQDRIDKAKYLGPRERDPQDGQIIRRYVATKEAAGKFIDRDDAVDWAQQAFNRAPSTERGLTIEVISLEDGLICWKGKK
jgi:hypothetical protein